MKDYKGPVMEEEDISKTKSLFTTSLVDEKIPLSSSNSSAAPYNEDTKVLKFYIFS